MDISGQQQMGVTSRIIKINLDENGQPMESEGSSFFYNQNVYFSFYSGLTE